MLQGFHLPKPLTQMLVNRLSISKFRRIVLKFLEADLYTTLNLFVWFGSYQSQHGDNSVEDLLDLGDVGVVLEGRVADTDDFMQVILDALVGSLGSYFGTEALEVASQLFSLGLSE